MYNVASDMETAMPEYNYTMSYIDANGAGTQKRFSGVFADYATARAAADAMLAAAQALTDAYIYKDSLAETTLIVGAASASSNVFERASATTVLDTPGKKYNLVMPAPVEAVFSGNSLLVDSLLWTNFTDNLAIGEFTVSDGEHVDGTISGKRIYVRSGVTNLPF